ncbi:ragulator complex protein LAMTOR4-like isoform X2 [Lampetra fluviatilis]
MTAVQDFPLLMKANTLTQGLEKIPDQLGYLVMSDDGVLASGGELENAERAGKVLVAMLRLAVTLTIEDKAEPCFKRLSVMFEDHSYLLTVSGQKIFVVKRKRSSSCPKEA